MACAALLSDPTACSLCLCLLSYFLLPHTLLSASTNFMTLQLGRVKLYPLWLRTEFSSCWHWRTGPCAGILSLASACSCSLSEDNCVGCSGLLQKPILFHRLGKFSPSSPTTPATSAQTQPIPNTTPKRSRLTCHTHLFWLLLPGNWGTAGAHPGALVTSGDPARLSCATSAQICTATEVRHSPHCTNNLTGLIPPVGFYWHPSSEYHISKHSLDMLPFE